jgi:hypothetical protein
MVARVREPVTKRNSKLIVEAARVKHLSTHSAYYLHLSYKKLQLGLPPRLTNDYEEDAQSVVGIAGPKRNDFAVGCRIAPHQPVRGGNSRTFDVLIDQSIQTFTEALAIQFLRVRQSSCRQS